MEVEVDREISVRLNFGDLTPKFRLVFGGRSKWSVPAKVHARLSSVSLFTG